MSTSEFFANFDSEFSWIKNHTIYVALHGSRAYGTHTENSDYDFKGIFIKPKEYYFGYLNNIEQVELKNQEPDTTIFEISKFFKLAATCNPNALEMLFVDSEDIFYISPLGKIIRDNRELFLSKQVKQTMSGYANGQLKRLKLHRGYLLNPPSTPPTRASLGLPNRTLIPKDQLMAAQAAVDKELNKYQFDFMDQLNAPSKIEIQSIISKTLAELKITADNQWMSAARQVGLSDNFIELMFKERQYTSKKKEWDQYLDWKKNRNPARAALEKKFGFDLKFAYHLVRLIRMSREILTTGQMLVKRPDREELLSIRNGAWSYEKLIEFSETENKIINKIYDDCTILPMVADQAKLNALCIKIVEEFLFPYSGYNFKKKISSLIKKVL